VTPNSNAIDGGSQWNLVAAWFVIDFGSRHQVGLTKIILTQTQTQHNQLPKLTISANLNRSFVFSQALSVVAMENGAVMENFSAN